MTEALALCDALRPEFALLDISLRNGSSGVDVAFGYIRKPYEAQTVLRSVEAAREVMGGGKPRTVPKGFGPFSAAG